MLSKTFNIMCYVNGSFRHLRDLFEKNIIKKEVRFQNPTFDYENFHMIDEDSFEEFNHKL